MNPFMAIVKKVMGIIISKVGTVLHSHNRIKVPGMEIMNFSLCMAGSPISVSDESTSNAVFSSSRSRWQGVCIHWTGLLALNSGFNDWTTGHTIGFYLIRLI